MSRGPDVATLLERALVHAARVAGCEAVIAQASMERWASVTFTGARHQITLALSPKDQALHWLASLPEAEFALRGHLVADLSVDRIDRHATGCTASMSILTVEDR